MRLTELGFDGFRNLASARLETPPGGAVLVGPNGHGKTNFLEAIYYLSRFRSFRSNRHAQAIAFGEDLFRIDGSVEAVGGRRSSIAVSADRRTRRIVVDGRPVQSVGEAIGVLHAVLVAPGDLALVGGGPEERRRYLDGLLGSTSAKYARALSDYERALRQRNELLRRWPPVDGSELASWDEILVDAGVPVVESRRAAAGALAERFGVIGGQIAGPEEPARYALDYRCAIDPSGERGDLAAAWLEALDRRRESDRRRGWTTVGPHRDDLVLRSDGRKLSDFGSQGEHRTAAIALRLVEAETLEEAAGQRPVLLLDDVFSELDEGRASRLLDWLGGRHQRFVTTPRPLPRLDGGLADWSVDDGRITPRLAAA